MSNSYSKWKHFPRYWPFVRGIYRSPVNSPHKGQWRGTLMYSLICAWINGWVNNREAGVFRCHRAHYDVTIMHGPPHKKRLIYPPQPNTTWTVILCWICKDDVKQHHAKSPIHYSKRLFGDRYEDSWVNAEIIPDRHYISRVAICNIDK